MGGPLDIFAPQDADGALQDTVDISPEVVQAVFDFCCILRHRTAAPCDPVASQHNVCIIRQVARAVGAHDAFFIGCIEKDLGNSDGFGDLAQQMHLLEHALARASALPRRLVKGANRPRSHKKHVSSLRDELGTMLAIQTIQILAEEPIAVIAALRALKGTAAALLLVHETLFYSCTCR